MASSATFKGMFDELATDGCIGDPAGRLAYAYIRVSTDEQADDGRSGLPRQIQHIHEAACNHGYRILWELVFADDDSGFRFKNRPQLSLLRQEIRGKSRRASAVIMESLDRLSRNADWHQGFLLDEMTEHEVIPIFWKEFGSRVERAVLGAIAQDGMEQEKRRMMEGKLHKARSGRVTATTPAYGYKLVDENGQEGQAAKKNTYYAINEAETEVIRLIFRRLLGGDTMRRIALDLQMAGIVPPKRAKFWEPSQIRLFVRNEVYKGDFYAHRWKEVVEQRLGKDGISIREVTIRRKRPREEWIHVRVPPIVSVEEWEAANRMLDQNKKMARRNAKVPFLLTGLVRCAHCGLLYTGSTSHYNKGKPRKNSYRTYRCPRSGIRPKYIASDKQCDNSQIACKVLDKVVWEIVCRALLEPEMLIEALDSDATSKRNQELEAHISFLERELTGKSKEDEKLERAYLAGAFDEHEFAARRRLLKSETGRLHEDLIDLRSKVLTPEQLQERKEAVLSIAKQLQDHHIPIDPTFELKQRMIKMVVNEITLNVREGWLTVDGAIGRKFTIENILADMDSLPLSA